MPPTTTTNRDVLFRRNVPTTLVAWKPINTLTTALAIHGSVSFSVSKIATQFK